jgi:hypothetical protein
MLLLVHPAMVPAYGSSSSSSRSNLEARVDSWLMRCLACSSVVEVRVHLGCFSHLPAIYECHRSVIVKAHFAGAVSSILPVDCALQHRLRLRISFSPPICVELINSGLAAIYFDLVRTWRCSACSHIDPCLVRHVPVCTVAVHNDCCWHCRLFM